MNALYVNLRRICREKGMQITDLERRAGLSDNSIYTWQRAAPSIEKVKRVADVLAVPIDDLVNDPTPAETA